MKQHTYTLQTVIRGAVHNILENNQVVGRAVLAKGIGWCLFTGKYDFIAFVQKKENIILVFRLRRGRIKTPKPKPLLCAACPYNKRRFLI